LVVNTSKANAARPAAIEVHIDALVVDGLAVRNPDHLGIVVQNELQTLLAKNGLGSFAHATTTGSNRQVATLRTPAMRTSRSPHAADAGEKIARAIHGGLRV
jgi:phage-related tail fiber protein